MLSVYVHMCVGFVPQTQAGNANSETKEMKAARLAVAGISTASMGKVRHWLPQVLLHQHTHKNCLVCFVVLQFDKRLDGESNKDARKLPGEKKRALPAEQHLDKARDMDVIRRVLDGSIDAAAAASGASRSKSPKGGKKSKPGKVVSRQGAKKARRR